jgi:hypothetical protein
LTMAEVGILIIFVLLLLLAFELWSRAVSSRGQVMVAETQLHALQTSDRQIRELADAVEAGANAAPDRIERLVRIVRAAAKTADGQSMLAAAQQELAKLEDVRMRLERVADSAEHTEGESVAGELERQSYELANKEGQLKRYEQQLAEAGFGKGERPCWVRPDGTIEYLYDVVLNSGGIKMREYVYPIRARERALLPMPEVSPTVLLSPPDFLKLTEPLFRQSIAENCRFFVVVYDGTASTEKELYKQLLRTVEGHFYKRLSRDPAPF